MSLRVPTVRPGSARDEVAGARQAAGLGARRRSISRGVVAQQLYAEHVSHRQDPVGLRGKVEV